MVAGLMLLSLLAAKGGCGSGFGSGNSPTPTPTGTGSASSFLYVTNFGDGTVSMLSRNPSSGALAFLSNAKAGAALGPSGLAVHPNNSLVYVANQADGNVYGFSVNTSAGTLTATAQVSVNDGTNSQPQQLAFGANGSFLYVANRGVLGVLAGSISEYAVDAASGKLTSLGTVTTGLISPVSIAANPAQTMVYVCDNGLGIVTAFSVGSSGSLTKAASALSLGVATGQPNAVAVDPSGKFVYVADATTGQVAAFNAAPSSGALAFLASYPTAVPPLPPDSHVIVPAQVGSSDFVYLSDNLGGMVWFSPQTGNSGDPLSLFTATSVGLVAPMGLAVDSTGGFLYAANNAGGSITVFSLSSSNGVPTYSATYATESTLNVNAAPVWIALSH